MQADIRLSNLKNIGFETLSNKSGEEERISYYYDVVKFDNLASIIKWMVSLTPESNKKEILYSGNELTEFQEFWNECATADIVNKVVGGVGLLDLHPADNSVLYTIQQAIKFNNDGFELSDKGLKSFFTSVKNTSIDSNASVISLTYYVKFDDDVNLSIMNAMLEKYAKFEKYEVCANIQKIKNEYVNSFDIQTSQSPSKTMVTRYQDYFNI